MDQIKIKYQKEYRKICKSLPTLCALCHRVKYITDQLENNSINDL